MKSSILQVRYVTKGKSFVKCRTNSRRFSRITVQDTPLASSGQSMSPPQIFRVNNESQGSVELRDTQRFIRASSRLYNSKTHLSNQDKISEQDDEVEGEVGDEAEKQNVPFSHLTLVPESSFSEMASQSFLEPIHSHSTFRTKSMPATLHTPEAQEEEQLAAGGISMTDAFQYIISPADRPRAGLILILTRALETPT